MHSMRHASLESLLPKATWPIVAGWLAPYPCSVVLHRPRKSKLGDFRPARPHRPTTITLNSDLSPHQMLLTLTHEIAHLVNWSKHGRRVSAHGPEWKACFGELLRELGAVESLPASYRKALLSHAQKPKSAVLHDARLYREIRRLEGRKETLLAELDAGQRFAFQGQTFTKVSSQRSRCRSSWLRPRCASAAPLPSVPFPTIEGPPKRWSYTAGSYQSCVFRSYFVSCVFGTNSHMVLLFCRCLHQDM